MKSALNEEWAVLVGEHERAFGRQGEKLRRGIVVDVATRGLIRKPLADVPFGRTGSLSELARGKRIAFGELAVEPKLVSDDGERGARSGAQVAEHFADKSMELVGIDGARGRRSRFDSHNPSSKSDDLVD